MVYYILVMLRLHVVREGRCIFHPGLRSTHRGQLPPLSESGKHVEAGTHQNAEGEDCVAEEDVVDHCSCPCWVLFIIP